MINSSTRADDPILWHVAGTLAFLLLAGWRITVPSAPYFDEVHYVPALRTFLEYNLPTNLEHPPLGKMIMAAGVSLFGDNPLGWRVMSLVFGALALFASMRAMWLTGRARAGSLLTGLFVGTNFLLFVHARIAMLDIFMVGFVMLAVWMVTGAFRQNETARLRLAIAGLALGAAMACKWNAVPLAVLPGLTFLAVRMKNGGLQFLTTKRSAPVRGMRLWEAGLWLGMLPLLTYWTSFQTYGLFAQPPADFSPDLVALHLSMLELQQQVPEPHTYQSVWWQWVGNLRPIWYLYEVIDGAQRGVMTIGNPLTMLAGLPALAWCAWVGVTKKRPDCLGIAVLFAASLALWVIAPKPVQFYFHYFLPAMFLCAALALAVEELWQRGKRLVPIALVGGALALFVWFYPILSAAPLSGEQAFLNWAWFTSWR